MAANGDPHITTLTNQHYDFNYLGYLRYFDNCNEYDRLVVNVKTDHGDYPRWKENDYMRKVFISYKDKYAIINTGFRGKPVKILDNDGFKYEEEYLDFDEEAYRYASNSKYKSNDEEDITDYLRNKPNIIIPELVRNKIKLEINDNFNIIIENVNEYNLQPCRIKLLINNIKNAEKWKGLVIDRKWAHPSKINSIHDLSYIPDPDPEQELPKLTKPSCKLNKHWV